MEKFQEGDLVWAKLRTWPWWPALVCAEHPSKGSFFSHNRFHVFFVDDPITTSWIEKQFVCRFIHSTECLPGNKYFDKSRGLKRLRMAEIADTMLRMSYQERIEKIVHNENVNRTEMPAPHISVSLTRIDGNCSTGSATISHSNKDGTVRGPQETTKAHRDDDDEFREVESGEESEAVSNSPEQPPVSAADDGNDCADESSDDADQPDDSSMDEKNSAGSPSLHLRMSGSSSPTGMEVEDGGGMGDGPMISTKPAESCPPSKKIKISTSGPFQQHGQENNDTSEGNDSDVDGDSKRKAPGSGSGKADSNSRLMTDSAGLLSGKKLILDAGKGDGRHLVDHKVSFSARAAGLNGPRAPSRPAPRGGSVGRGRGRPVDLRGLPVSYISSSSGPFPGTSTLSRSGSLPFPTSRDQGPAMNNLGRGKFGMGRGKSGFSHLTDSKVPGQFGPIPCVPSLRGKGKGGRLPLASVSRMPVRQPPTSAAGYKRCAVPVSCNSFSFPVPQSTTPHSSGAASRPVVTMSKGRGCKPPASSAGSFASFGGEPVQAPRPSGRSRPTNTGAKRVGRQLQFSARNSPTVSRNSPSSGFFNVRAGGDYTSSTPQPSPVLPRPAMSSFPVGSASVFSMPPPGISTSWNTIQQPSSITVSQMMHVSRAGTQSMPEPNRTAAGRRSAPNAHDLLDCFKTALQEIRLEHAATITELNQKHDKELHISRQIINTIATMHTESLRAIFTGGQMVPPILQSPVPPSITCSGGNSIANLMSIPLQVVSSSGMQCDPNESSSAESMFISNGIGSALQSLYNVSMHN